MRDINHNLTRLFQAYLLIALVDFVGNKVRASRTAIPWPDEGYSVRRASINSFGYGGSNAHAIIEQPSVAARSNHVSSYKATDGEDDFEEEESERPYTLVLSANDAVSLRANIQVLCNHLINPSIKVDLADLAYTLSERRTRLWHRAFVTTRTTEVMEKDFAIAKKSSQPPKIGIVFTGQGAQWSQMGNELLETFPWTRSILEDLDQVLRSQQDPPKWSLVAELTEARSAEHLRQPEFSQPLVTALQLCIMAVLESWGIESSSVVGHSSGEIAAAYAAGLLDRAGAIKAAFYRGQAAVICKAEAEADADAGMLAVGLGAEAVSPFLEKYVGSAWIACFNSPSSVTISGRKSSLEALAEDVKAADHFARMLQVDLAYHSEFMGVIGTEYYKLLNIDDNFKPLNGSSNVTMFSSVTGSKMETSADAQYWKSNMISPVRFTEALKELIIKDSPDMLIEVGPSGALAGPVSQTLKSLPNNEDILYCAAWSRGSTAGKSLFDVAGRLFITGAPINMSLVNKCDINTTRIIVDLPNYSWNHSAKYWHENAASKDWRYRQFIHHDLLGSKVIGTSWQAPTWRKNLSLADVPWLRDHKMGPDILMPGAGLATLALEAMYQKHCALNPDEIVSSPNELAYRFRNIKFDRAVALEEGKLTTIMVMLSSVPGSKDWHEFRIRTTAADVTYEHCNGLIRIQDPTDDDEALTGADLAPLKHPQSAKLWYKAQREVGMNFGPSFQLIKSVESVSGSRNCRTVVGLEPPPSKYDPQSYYPLHPAVLDNCLQTGCFANAVGERSLITGVMIPALVDDLVINKMPQNLYEGLSVAESIYTGRGRKDLAKNWIANIAIHDPESGALIMRCRGLNYIRLDVEEKADPHTFNAITWKPDISLLTQDQLMYLSLSVKASIKLDKVIDLISHKSPTLKVLEMNLDETDNSSSWFQGKEISARAAYSQYDFASSNAQTLVSVQIAKGSRRNTAFHIMTPGKEALGLPITESTYDLAIIKAPEKTDIAMEELLSNLKPLLKPNAFTLLVRAGDSLNTKLSGMQTSSPQTPGTNSEASSDSPSDETPASSLSSTPPLKEKPSGHEFWNHQEMERLTKTERIFSSVMEIDNPLSSSPAYLCSSAICDDTADDPWNLIVAGFGETTPFLPPSLQAMLEASGCKMSTTPIDKLALPPDNEPSSIVLVLDELQKPVLTEIAEKEWDALKQVIGSGNPLLWVTKGAQTSNVTNPNNAMVQGLFRTARREDPQAKLTTLDVQSATSAATGWALVQVLRKIRSGAGAETEYAERDGILLVQRVVPDIPINEFKAAEGGKGLEPVVKGLHESETLIRLQAEKLGTLQSLTWCETNVGEVPIEPGWIEIEIMAGGVNFKVSENPSSLKLGHISFEPNTLTSAAKDVAVTMGIVPGDEHTIGCECAGYVKRLGPGVTKHKVGDRVCGSINGTYANRVPCPEDRAHIIPTWMSYEDAATIPLVYLTAIYGFYHLGNLKEGQVRVVWLDASMSVLTFSQSILIHSAAGGVGIAAIQLAQYKKADVSPLKMK